MKKVLLVLLIIILLGECGLGCWFFLTANRYNKNSAVGLKLQLTETVKIDWVDNYTTEEKLKYLNNLSESEYIEANKDTWFSNVKIDILYFLKDNLVELHKTNSTETTTYYYLSSPNGKTLRIYTDENFIYSYYDGWYGVDIFVVKENDGSYWTNVVEIEYDDLEGPGVLRTRKAFVKFKLKVIK